MTCEEVDELLGAYALDALPADQAQAVREHLDGCPEQAVRARELRSTASRLSAVPDDVAPAPELRSRVLAAVASTPQDGLDSAKAPDRDGRSERRVGPAQQADGAKIVAFPRRVPLAWGAIAAVVAAAFVGLVVWNIVLQRGRADSVERLASRASSVEPLQPQGAQGGGVVIFYRGEKKAMLVGNGLQILDASARTYQLWAIGESGAPKSIGLMQPGADGEAIAVVPFDPTSANTLAVTIEPAGGSDQPTSSPILVATPAT